MNSFNWLPSCLTSLLLCLNMSLSIASSLSKTTTEIDHDKDTLKAKQWIKLSNKSLESNKNLSYAYADSAYNIYQLANNKNGMGDALVRMGLALSAMGKFDQSIENYQSALTLFTELKNRNKMAKVLNNIGYSQMQKGQYDDAISNYLKSLEYRQAIQDTSGIASCYTNMAIVFAIKNDLNQAEKYFAHAVQMYRKLGDQNMLNKNLLNLGGVYKDKGQYQKSIEQIRAVYTYYASQRNLGEIARCHYILGANFESLNQYDSANNNYNKALKIYEQIDNKKQIAGTKLKLAGIADKLKDYESAIHQGEQALKMAQDMHTLQIEMQTYFALSKSYFNKGDYKSAYENRLEYERIKDSIFSQESNQKILELQAQFENKIKEKEIQTLTTEKRLSELELTKKKNSNYWLTGILSLLLVVSLLILNQYRINRINTAELKKKNQIIETSLAEKETLLREIHHRVKNNLQFIWSLFNLQTRYIKDPLALETLTEGKNRIKTMALIHQKLYQKDNISELNMADYIPGLAANILETYHIHPEQIQLTIQAEKIALDIDTAIPLGLIMNEIITNSLKHFGPSDKRKAISIEFKQLENTDLFLNIKDNGKGLPIDFDPEKGESFGFKLILSLVKQLKGDIKWQTSEGTELEIRLPYQSLKNKTA